MNCCKILIVDDDESLGDILGDILTSANYDVQWVRSGWQALQLLERWAAELILLDLRLPGQDGLMVLGELQSKFPWIQVIMISGHGTIGTALEAVRLGAADWMEKPLDKERVLDKISSILENKEILQKKSYQIEEALHRFGMIGVCPAMQEVFQLIDKVAESDIPVIICGESGTGKELVARAIHLNSRRAHGAFVHLNCAAIPDGLIESELFGHTRGAYTGAIADQAGRFQAAHNGTLFLDEIGDLSLSAQAKLLRAIETGEVSRIGTNKTEIVQIRFISATNKDLSAMIRKEYFREDLFYRVAVIEIFLPPLRERRDEILPLVQHFLNLFCTSHGVTQKEMDHSAFAILLAHEWPGNIRELRNFIEKLIILTDSHVISVQQVARILKLPNFTVDCPDNHSFAEAKACFEKAFLQHALQTNDWNIVQTGHAIGMERSLLYKKIKKYELKISKIVDS